MKYTLLSLTSILLLFASVRAEEPQEDAQRKLWEPSLVVQKMQENIGQADTIALVVDISPSMTSTLADMGEEFKRLQGLIAASDATYTPMGLITFGKKAKVIERPTKNYTKIATALGKVDSTLSGGKECPMAAIRLALESFAPKLERLVIFLVYDEAGDDQETLEETIELCRQKKATVHLIGRDAAFGKADWTWQQILLSAEASRVEILEATLGSEMPRDSLIYETRFLQRIWDPEGRGLNYCVSSGYAHWALSRLAHETGGAFFPLKSGVSRVAYAHETTLALKAEYRPSLEPLDNVLEAMAKHQLGRFTQPTLEAMSKVEWPNMVFKGVQSPEDMTMRFNKCLKEIATASQQVDAVLEAHLKGRSAYRESLLRARADWELTGASLMVIRFHLERLKDQVEGWLKDSAILKLSGRVIIVPDSNVHAESNETRESRESLQDLLGEADGAVDMTSRFLESLTQITNQPCSDAASMRLRAEKALELVMGNHKNTPWAASARLIKEAMGDYILKPIKFVPGSGPITNPFQ
ncbi:MAG: vWA domain-containing protein [Planctomycetota bacterium]